VVAHGLLREDEPGRDLVVAEPRRHEAEHLMLAVGELWEDLIGANPNTTSPSRDLLPSILGARTRISEVLNEISSSSG
jgi:hypothetical protein